MRITGKAVVARAFEISPLGEPWAWTISDGCDDCGVIIDYSENQAGVKDPPAFHLSASPDVLIAIAHAIIEIANEQKEEA